MSSSSNKIYQEGEKADGFTIETTINKSDSLPFSLYDPKSDGKLAWTCGEGPEGNIVMVWTYTENGKCEKECRFLKNVEEAIGVRDKLLNEEGWKKTKPPKVEFTINGSDGKSRPANRKEKRFINKQMRKQGVKGFDSDDE